MSENKYTREIFEGIHVDVYDVLRAFNVKDQAVGHAVKKLLCMGQRGHKNPEQDLTEAIQSLERALQDMPKEPVQQEFPFGRYPDMYLYTKLGGFSYE
jgi:hypothetical protein